MEVQEELDEMKQEKRELKRQLQLADSIVKEDLYTAYYAVSENEEIVANREIEIPGMEVDMLAESTAKMIVEPDISVKGIKSDNNQNEISRQKEQADSARKQQTDENGQTHTLKKKTQGHRFFNFPDKSAFCPNSKYYL